MKELFNDILSIKDVKGIMLFSLSEKLIFKEFVAPVSEEAECGEWWAGFIPYLDGIREADLVFENCRLYIRKTGVGYLAIYMGLFAPNAMMRLTCDLLLPALNEMKTAKGLGRLFRKKR